MTIAEVMLQAQVLSRADRKALAKWLIDSLNDAPFNTTSEQRPSISDLRGLGKEIWQGIDPQAYVDQIRSEWDDRLSISSV